MKKKWVLAGIVAVIAAAALAFGLYAADGYPASEAALACLSGSDAVRVTDSGDVVALDGPGTACGLVFYPGARVAPEAYLPLLTRLAGDGVDCYLVRMPFNLSLFGRERATGVLAGHDHERWYMAGHSLGGVVAAQWVAAHPGAAEGLILLAAYPDRALPGDARVLTLYGSEDGVLNPQRLRQAAAYLPAGAVTTVLPGGNHARFGDYGEQRGDNPAAVSREEQQAWAAREMERLILPEAPGATS